MDTFGGQELRKTTAFVLTASESHHLLLFEHPMAGLQLPAGTVEQDEQPVAAATREVREETGLELTDSGIVLDETTRTLASDRAVLTRTINHHGNTFRRGHTVSVVSRHGDDGPVEIREDIYDYRTTPPELTSTSRGEVPPASLSSTIRRTFVLFVEPVDDPPKQRWTRHADGHEFEVFWTPFRADIPLHNRQKTWLESNSDDIERHLDEN